MMPTPAPMIDQSLAHTLALLTAGQKELFAGLESIISRMNSQTAQTAPVNVDNLASVLGGISLDRQQPPHISHVQRQVKTPYAPPPRLATPAISSPSEGRYARDLSACMALKDPKIREHLRFTGESKSLRQFLTDIYDVLDQHAMDFSADKRRINWMAPHFTSTNSDVNPAQAWFSSLLMKNAYEHGVADQYANLKALHYVIPPLLSADAFIGELILVFGDKSSSKTAREALDKCKQGSTSIIDYNSRFGSLLFHV